MRIKTHFWIGTACLLVVTGCAGVGRDAQRSDVHSNGRPSHHHRGPEVLMNDAGPARTASVLLEEFDEASAMELVTFIDQYYRAPGNEGYDAVLDRMEELLRSAGFGRVDGLELQFLSQEMEGPAWTPRSASLVLVVDGEEIELQAFSKACDRDRVMLPINTPSCSVDGPVIFDFGKLVPGSILVTDVPAAQVSRRARKLGAVAIISASLESFNSDPTGQERHLDAIQFTSVPVGTKMPVAQITRRNFDRIKQAAENHDSVRLTYRAQVDFDPRPLRTLVARVIGKGRGDEAVAMASHVQEPGACDNASGAGGLVESACVLARLLEKGDLDWPARTIVFLWGDEFDQTRAWLAHTDRRTVAGFSSDMTGESHAETGAIALLERGPDPGALLPLAPDEHTPWGAGRVSEDDLNPNALAVIARCAMNDVARFAGGWISADHPWEGGSDHDEFIDLGIPAVLFWHFTDFAYHTSLDRLEMVDSNEIRKTQVALVSTALAVADPRAPDLERYRASIRMEQELRVAAAEAEGRSDIALAWRDWCRGAAEWLDRELSF